MPSNVFMVELDQNPVLSLQFDDLDLGQFDTVTLRMRRPDGSLVEVDGTVDDPAAGLVHFAWAEGDLVKGVSDLEIVLVDGDGKSMTLPSKEPIKGVVRGRV